MEKYFINKFVVTSMVLLTMLVGTSTIMAAKMARLSIDELTNQAVVVAVVKIEATEVTTESQRQIHTEVEKPYIRHTAFILEKIKDKNISAKKISFLSTIGLIAGNKYIVFLSSKETNAEPIVSINGYAALVISLVSMKSGFQEGVRVPESYISIPDSFSKEPGETAKNELPAHVWIKYEDLINYLKK